MSLQSSLAGADAVAREGQVAITIQEQAHAYRELSGLFFGSFYFLACLD
jgi:hypothetical protein